MPEHHHDGHFHMDTVTQKHDRLRELLRENRKPMWLNASSRGKRTKWSQGYIMSEFLGSSCSRVDGPSKLQSAAWDSVSPVQLCAGSHLGSHLAFGKANVGKSDRFKERGRGSVKGIREQSPAMITVCWITLTLNLNCEDTLAAPDKTKKAV